MPEYEERTAWCGQIEVDYVSWAGDGPPLLLIHGLSGRWQGWLNVVPLLQPRWRITALDLRGHGKSGRATDGYRLPGYAADVEEFIRTVIRGPVNVIGHSLGAMTTMVLAANAPELVRAAVLEDPPVYAFRRSERRQFRLTHAMASSSLTEAQIAELILRERPENTPEQAAFTARSWRALDPEAARGVLDASYSWDDWIEDTMRRVKCPTLLLQANLELGGALADADASRVAELIPNCTVVRWTDTGHGMHVAKPQEFVAAAERHFKSVTSIR
ncbi:MAG: alpha/beta hydrolase [Chloroflexi bacterium]|nr:alpha/beta hydrolase [Chloroflexota bacterium]